MGNTWHQDMLSCTDCGLCEGRRNVVAGDGPVPCKYMLIGEAPGEFEDKTGIPFISDAGRELEYFMGLAGIAREDVFLTNVVKCRPTTNGKNRIPKPAEIKACRHWLEKEIQWCNPSIIILLGSTALSTMLPGTSLKEHGIPLTVLGKCLIPMFHPAASLHNPSLRSVIEADWKMLPERIALAGGVLPHIAPNVTTPSQMDVIAIDTETTGLDPTKAELVCMSQAYLRVGALAPYTQVYSVLDKSCEDTNITKVYHNYKYEYKLFQTMGLHPTPPVFDTMIAAALLGEEQIGLKLLARKYLGRQMTSAKALIAEAQTKINSTWLASCGGTKITKKLIQLHGAPLSATMKDVPPDILTPYAAEDAAATLELYQRFAPEIEKQGLQRIMDLEMAVVPVLAEMEMKGVLIDVNYLTALKEEWSVEAKILAGRYPFNLNSSQQIGKYMETLHLPLLATTETGKPSTSKDALSSYKTEPFVKDLLRHKEIAKLINTYTDSLINKVGEDGRIHPEFNQVRGESEDWRGATKTGRLSSSNPNFQNLPVREEEGKKVRRAIVSPPGMSLVSFDYAQIEPLIIAYRAGDKALLGLYGAGGDVYEEVANRLDSKLSPADRRFEAKTTVLGVTYGEKEWGLARKLRRSIEEAADVIRRLFKSYPEIAQYIQKTGAEARRDGFTKTVWGRRRTESGIFSTDWVTRQAAERELLNHTIQGTAADLCKQAMVNCYNGELLPIVQVHDELIFEIPDEKLDITIPSVIQYMQAMDLEVPIRISVKVGDNWGEMKDYGD